VDNIEEPELVDLKEYAKILFDMDTQQISIAILAGELVEII
jgi:hypothetical protein